MATDSHPSSEYASFKYLCLGYGVVSVFGASAGSVYHFLKGMYTSKNGERFIGGTRALCSNAPRIAKGTALYSGIYSGVAWTLMIVKPEFNLLVDTFAGAATGVLTQMRYGFRRAALMGVLFPAALYVSNTAGLYGHLQAKINKQQTPKNKHTSFH